jgi:ribonuclease T1
VSAVTRSYRPFIALGALLMLLAVVAMGYLLVNGPDSGDSTGAGADAVPTEAQILGSTTTRVAAGATVPTTTRVAAGSAVPTTTSRPAKDPNGLTIVRAAQLPKEAQQTLALIAKGGPYPFDRDGVVFQNREGILPKKTSGYYHEYTVVTPGERDRGARRIVTGSGDERYYTADHYESFVRVEVGP